MGHVQIIRHTLKKAGVGSKVRGRRQLNGRKFKLVLIIAQIICVHIAIPTAIAVRIIAIFEMVLGRTPKEHLTKQKVIGAEIKSIHDIILVSDIGYIMTRYRIVQTISVYQNSGHKKGHHPISAFWYTISTDIGKFTPISAPI